MKEDDVPMPAVVIPRFTKKRKEEPIEIEDLDGTVKSYIVREITGPQRAAYMGNVVGRTKIDGEGNPIGMKDMTGLQETLIAMSLFDDKNLPVPMKMIEDMPSTSIGGLFEIAQRISGLDKKANDREKKV